MLPHHLCAHRCFSEVVSVLDWKGLDLNREVSTLGVECELSEGVMILYDRRRAEKKAK